MKRGLLISSLVFAALAGFAQSTVLDKVWATSHSTDGLQEMNARVDQLVTDISKHHYRNDLQKLSALFSKTHVRFLRNFVQYTGIEELNNGRYNCLTATSLFADILAKAGYNYNIIETNYHIFIVVKTLKGDVVLETTDRFGGFINDRKKMSKALATYRENRLVSATPATHQYSFNIYQSVDTNELEGLLYFNQAVKAFNSHQWSQCSDQLSASSGKSNSPRIAELAIMLYHSVAMSDNVDEDTRSSIMTRWKGVVLAGMPVASR
jgi:hypothetical protein